MECVFDVERIGKELDASVTAGYDGIERAYYIWSEKSGASFRIYYPESRFVSDITKDIENDYIEKANRFFKIRKNERS